MKKQIKTHEDVEKELIALRDLFKNDPETAKIVARAALIRTGILNKDGSSKESIVDYSHSLTYESENKPKRRIRK